MFTDIFFWDTCGFFVTGQWEKYMENNKRTLPLLALRNHLILPGMLMHFDIQRPDAIQAVEEALNTDQFIFLVAQKKDNVEKPSQEDLYQVGTIAKVKQMLHMPEEAMRVMVMGVDRAVLLHMTDQNNCQYAVVETPDDTLNALSEVEEKNMVIALKEQFSSVVSQLDMVADKAIQRVEEIYNLPRLIDEMGKILPLDLPDRQRILETLDIRERYACIMELLANIVYLQELRQEFQQKVKERVNKSQKDYLLREQLQVIQKELGNDAQSKNQQLQEKLDQLQASEQIKEQIQREINRLQSLGNNGTELAVQRNYVDTLLALPWDLRKEEEKDFSRTEQILESGHYGLEKVKERILESLAVRMLQERGDSPILCLVGPPGTGKTSIAKSIAEALDKVYVRISLGGVRDEAEIRGHRRTYVGAMPGRIANALKQAKVKNPLLLFDEIDKVGTDQRGDTASALLEVLDREQNQKFVDHYVELPLDLSEVFFVCTANQTSTIPQPLLDRMEVIEVSSYTEEEKYQIAKKYLWKKQLVQNGLDSKQISIDKKALMEIINGYTKEAGVRKLERSLGTICRKVARELLVELQEKKLDQAALREAVHQKKRQISLAEVGQYLGKRKYQKKNNNKKATVGVVHGLAWTSVGGTTLEIEANTMPGKGQLQLTGQLGDVMKESAQIALSYVRSIGKKYDIDQEFYQRNDVHIHVPEGATPKDGPSAGITIATALLSAITKKKVRQDIAMTGELTLQGRVLAIGGLKEKLLAAKQAKAKMVCVPLANQTDVEKLEEDVTKGLEIVYVSQVEEVFAKCFINP